MAITDQDRSIPSGLATDEFRLRPITVDDAQRDFEAVMETREPLRLWEQSTWPADDFTVEGNREDLEGLEKRHGEHKAYTYTVIDPDDTEALGCVYVFATEASFLARSTVTALTDLAWSEVDAVVYFWARLSRMEQGMDGRLLEALRRWFASEWDVATTVFVTNEQFTQQVELIESAGLSRVFELEEPEKPGTYLIYA